MEPSLNTSGWTATGLRVRKGDVFQIAGVSWHVQSQQSTGRLRDFTVLADRTPIRADYFALDLACDHWSWQPQPDGERAPRGWALMTFLGAASTQYMQNLAIRKWRRYAGYGGSKSEPFSGTYSRVSDPSVGVSMRELER